MQRLAAALRQLVPLTAPQAAPGPLFTDRPDYLITLSKELFRSRSRQQRVPTPTVNVASAHRPCSPRQPLATASRVAETCPAPAVSYAAPTVVMVAKTSHMRRTSASHRVHRARTSHVRRFCASHRVHLASANRVRTPCQTSWLLSLPGARQQNLSSSIHKFEIMMPGIAQTEIDNTRATPRRMRAQIRVLDETLPSTLKQRARHHVAVLATCACHTSWSRRPDTCFDLSGARCVYRVAITCSVHRASIRFGVPRASAGHVVLVTSNSRVRRASSCC